MISIIDYGLGNLKAFINIYKRLNIAAELVTTKQQLVKADKIILPGVGAFDQAMSKLNNSVFYELFNEMVLEKEVPVLGICVGMQMLAKSSEEGKKKGLSFIDGNVKLLNVSKINHLTKLPHMGWNNINIIQNNPLFIDFDKSPLFYFLHSYYFVANNKKNIISEVNYGEKFTCSINHNNIYGVQFHPEKSHNNGIELLKNFSSL